MPTYLSHQKGMLPSGLFLNNAIINKEAKENHAQ